MAGTNANGHAAPSAVAVRRREQIIAAAAEIVATEGMHKLSLSNIESRVGMTRGHLTYYFRTKEDILLALFDRMVGRLREQAMAAGGPKPGTGQAWDCVRFILQRHLQSPRPEHGAVASLMHTFLAQIGYREDFRKKLASHDTEIRGMIAADYAASVPHPTLPPTVLASLIMAVIQGLSNQLAVNPQAFDRDEMTTAVSALLAPLFHREGDSDAR